MLQVCRGGEAEEFARDDVVDAVLQVTPRVAATRRA
jgi:hypothetical protein